MTRAEAMLYDLRYAAANSPSRLMTVSIEIDPITNVEAIAFFNDDGHGNGLCVFEMTTADFQQSCANWERIYNGS